MKPSIVVNVSLVELEQVIREKAKQLEGGEVSVRRNAKGLENISVVLNPSVQSITDRLIEAARQFVPKTFTVKTAKLEYLSGPIENSICGATVTFND